MPPPNSPRKYLFTFMRGIRRVEFGPYDHATDAADAFQRKYGYWPEPPVAQELYYPVSNVTTHNPNSPREQRF